jgi:hypothetical protein
MAAISIITFLKSNPCEETAILVPNRMVGHKQEMQNLFRKSPKATTVIFFFAARIVITEQRLENNHSKVKKASQRGGPSAKETVMG